MAGLLGEFVLALMLLGEKCTLSPRRFPRFTFQACNRNMKRLDEYR